MGKKRNIYTYYTEFILFFLQKLSDVMQTTKTMPRFFFYTISLTISLANNVAAIFLL